MNNKQVAEPVIDRQLLEVAEIFYSIQGEGPFTGEPAVFIRLAGCNLQCHFCDTQYTYRTKMTVETILKDVNKLLEGKRKRFVVITGGEPFRQNIKKLVKSLLKEGIEIQIETNGTLYLDLPYDEITVVCSPKALPVHKDMMNNIGVFKILVKHSTHGEYDMLLPKDFKIPKGKMVYVQPLDEQEKYTNKKNKKAAFKAALKNECRLGYQLQKVFGVA